jgi:predicted dehydrogenase
MVKSVNKIGAAILGLGGMGQVHVQAAKDSPYINKVVGYEPDESNALKRWHELGIAVTTKLEDILRDEDIKVVYIASPNKVHCSQSVQCLKAGKAVLCEKPMGLNLQEAQEMLIAEAETGGYLQIGFELHFSKIYALVKEWIDQGKIGRPLNAICDYFCSEFHLKNSWRSANKGCFLIGEKLSHYLDLSRWWIGEEVEDVYCVNAPNFVSYFNHADNHHIVCKFTNGATSSLSFVMGTAEIYLGDPLQDMLLKQADDGHCLKYLIYGLTGLSKRMFSDVESVDGNSPMPQTGLQVRSLRL